MWVDLAWDGQDPNHPYLLPDGREYVDVIAAGHFGQIVSQVWLTVTNPGKAQDFLWSTGMALTVASCRLADALTDTCGDEACEIFPVTVRRTRSPDLTDYLLLIPRGNLLERRVREFPRGHRASSRLDVDAGVLEDLRIRGITGFDVADARQVASDIAAASTSQDEPPIQSDPGLWTAQSVGGKTRLPLTLGESTQESMIEVPRELLPERVRLQHLIENDNGSLSSASPASTLSRPLAEDASGTRVEAFWFQDDERLIINVDHIPGRHDYPIVVLTEICGR